MEPRSSLGCSLAEGGAGSWGKPGSSYPLAGALLAPSGREPPRRTWTTGPVPRLPSHASPCHSCVLRKPFGSGHRPAPLSFNGQ